MPRRESASSLSLSNVLIWNRRLRGKLTENVDALLLDLLEWLNPAPRPYAEVLDAWRTSCPKLPVWEEANERGFIRMDYVPGEGRWVRLSQNGREHLRLARSNSVITGSDAMSGVSWD